VRSVDGQRRGDYILGLGELPVKLRVSTSRGTAGRRAHDERAVEGALESKRMVSSVEFGAFGVIRQTAVLGALALV
jgi:hypothetical protein